jgi:hypothetical protein
MMGEARPTREICQDALRNGEALAVVK